MQAEHGPIVVDQQPSESRPGFSVERRANRIANARSVTFGLAASFVGLALIGAIVMRFADSQNFPSVGLASWWALQTVTTVGYGDVVPTTTAGKVVGGVEMAIGVSLISLLTAAVTSTIIQRGETDALEETRLHQEQIVLTITGALSELDDRLGRLDARLDRIEARLDET
jgi:voltage-gated potassium channel